MWNQYLLPILRAFYSNCGLTAQFNIEQPYLQNAYHQIDQLWMQNLNQISTIKYIMLSESPLWGNIGKYIYNQGYINQSSFFNSNQLLKALRLKGINPLPAISHKQDFIDYLNTIGFLIVDVSPFALNKSDTSINYSRLSGRKKNNYYHLIQPTISTFFDTNISQIQGKLAHDYMGVKVFYRYPRIKNHLGTDIANVLTKYGLQILNPPYDCVFYQGGGIDTTKLAHIL